MNSPVTAVRGALALLFFLAVSPGPASAATTLSTVNSFSFGANLGWLDWRGDSNDGAVVGSYVCRGYIYSGNVGWINLGGGSPANRIQYQNDSATDFGVNLDDSGNLRGRAYGANIGWINFENLGAPRIDLNTGRFSGSCYSANCGWISLSNAFAQVQTDVILPGTDSDGDSLADAWELLNFGHLARGADGDADGDGALDLQEFRAGTNPNDPSSLLVITAYTNAPQGTSPSLVWQSVLTRHYFIEQSLDLRAPLWFDSGLGLIPPDGATTTRLVGDTGTPGRFFRVRAVKPLSP